MKHFDKMTMYLKDIAKNIIVRFKRLEKRDFNLKQKYKHAVKTIYEEYLKDRCKAFDIKIYHWEFSESERNADKNFNVVEYCKEMHQITKAENIPLKKQKMSIVLTLMHLFNDGVSHPDIIQDKLFQPPKPKLSIKNISGSNNNSGVIMNPGLTNQHSISQSQSTAQNSMNTPTQRKVISTSMSRPSQNLTNQEITAEYHNRQISQTNKPSMPQNIQFDNTTLNKNQQDFHIPNILPANEKQPYQGSKINEAEDFLDFKVNVKPENTSFGNDNEFDLDNIINHGVTEQFLVNNPVEKPKSVQIQKSCIEEADELALIAQKKLKVDNGNGNDDENMSLKSMGVHTGGGQASNYNSEISQEIIMNTELNQQ